MAKEHHQPIALNLIPRTGDELLGLPVALQALEQSGWKVVHLLVDSGANKKLRDHAEEQAQQASLIMDSFMLQLQHPIRLPSSRLEQPAAQPSSSDEVQEMVSQSLEAINPALVISTGPQDDHPAGQELGWAVMQAIEAHARKHQLAPSWWIWSCGTGGVHANSAWGYDSEEMDRLQAAAAVYRGLPDLPETIQTLARLRRLTCDELDLGDFQYAERWLDVHLCDDLSWRPGPLSLLDLDNPLPEDHLGDNMRNWLQAQPEQAAHYKPIIPAEKAV